MRPNQEYELSERTRQDRVRERGDVLLSIDGNPVFNNGLIRMEGELVNMNEVVERKFAGDVLRLAFLRDGKRQEADVELKRFDPYVKLGEQYNQRPRYLVYAGLVFQPMDKNLMDAHQITDSAASYLFDNYLAEKLYVERPEPVVPVMRPYQWWTDMPLTPARRAVTVVRP